MKTVNVIAKYSVEYQNGTTQVKCLVDHDDFMSIPKDKRDDFCPKGMYFTTKSPLFEAISTGILKLPDHQGGEQKCVLTKI